jgi:hypothetical protein
LNGFLTVFWVGLAVYSDFLTSRSRQKGTFLLVPQVPITINIDGDTSVLLLMIVVNKLILCGNIINDDISSSSNAVAFYDGGIPNISNHHQ